MWETWVQSLGWEDLLKKGKATHSNILVWRIPWTSPWGCKESDITERLSLSFRVMSSRIYWWKERAIVPCLQQDISGSKVEPEPVENWRGQGGPTQTPGLLKRQRGQDISGQKEIWVRREKRLKDLWRDVRHIFWGEHCQLQDWTKRATEGRHSGGDWSPRPPIRPEGLPL